MAISSPAITVTGLSDLQRSLRAIDPMLPREVAKVAKAASLIVATTAKGIAPKQSGTLAGTIKSLGSQRTARVQAGRGIEYAGVIHYGWPKHNIEPQPFLTDALAEDREEVYATFYGGITALIRTVGL